jgi:alcohol dehydrogenase class IV
MLTWIMQKIEFKGWFIMWENKMNIKTVSEIRTKTTVFFGIGAINKITQIADELLKRNISKVVVVTGRGSYIKTGAWDVVKKALVDKKIEYILYSKITPNPTVDEVDAAAKIAIDFGAAAVIAIGGGSPIDTGKSVAILIANPEKKARDIYEFKFTPVTAAPVIAINLTHGTGTEADRFAVVSIPEKNYKPAIAYDCIYPLYSIDDPALMTMLPEKQTVYVSVDAVNHVIEASTSLATNPLVILLAKETIRLVGKYLPIAVKNPKNLTARYYLLYASMLGGMAFDNGLLHYTHALEHPLSAVKPELTHGLGLSILLPAVIKEIYPASGEILAEILSPIVKGLNGSPDEAQKAFDGVQSWLVSLGITEKLNDVGFTEADVEMLTKLAFETPSLDLLLSMAPVKATRKTVSEIYMSSF